MKKADNKDSSQGLIFEEILREYLSVSSERLELEIFKSQEQFRLSSEKFDRKMKESQEQLKTSSEKFIRQMEESQEHLKMSSDKFVRKMEKSQEQLKLSTEKYGRKMENTNEISKITKRPEKNFGKLAGSYKVLDIRERFNEMGYCFTEHSLNKEISELDNPNTITEIDILLESDNLVMAIDVKSKPNQSDVDAHINRIEVLRRTANRRKDTREYLGAIAGNMSQHVRDYVLQKGFYAIEKTRGEQPHDTLKISTHLNS